eukprot:8651711-Pyramimonas_sp.AAC.1
MQEHPAPRNLVRERKQRPRSKASLGSFLRTSSNVYKSIRPRRHVSVGQASSSVLFTTINVTGRTGLECALESQEVRSSTALAIQEHHFSL